MNHSDLKQAIFKGGMYLIIRQIIFMGLFLTSVLTITRTLGPEHYGWASIGLSVTPFATSLADMGLKVYIIRKPEDCPRSLQGEILFFLMISGGCVTGLSILMAPVIADWVHIPEVAQILTWMAPAVWMNACSGVPLGMLERNLQYQRSSVVEMGAQVIYYVSAIPLVLHGWDVWGVVASYALQAVFQLVMAFSFYPLRPVWPRQLEGLRQAIHSGLSYSTSQWILQGRGLIIPLLLGKFLGAEAVGLINAAGRITDVLGFVRGVTLQIGLSGFAKLQDDFQALRRALSQSMIYQAFMLVLALGLFTIFSPILVPIILGAKWIGVIGLLPFLSIISLAKGIFELHGIVLYSMGHNVQVLRFHGVNLIAVSLGIVLLCPTYGVWGYILAELACLGIYGLLHQSIRQRVGSPNYAPVFWLVIGSLPAFFLGSHLAIWMALPMLGGGLGLAYLISPGIRAAAQSMIHLLMQQFRQRKSASHS